MSQTSPSVRKQTSVLLSNSSRLSVTPMMKVDPALPAAPLNLLAAVCLWTRGSVGPRLIRLYIIYYNKLRIRSGSSSGGRYRSINNKVVILWIIWDPPVIGPDGGDTVTNEAGDLKSMWETTDNKEEGGGAHVVDGRTTTTSWHHTIETQRDLIQQLELIVKQTFGCLLSNQQRQER